MVTTDEYYDFKTFGLAASVRLLRYLLEATLASGRICSMVFSMFQQRVKHPLTDLGLKKFLADWNPQLQN